MREDLLVFDNEYKYAKDEIKDYSKEIHRQMLEYKACIMYILENDIIKDTNVVRALKNILEEIDDMSEDVLSIGERMFTLCGDYIKQLDKDDEFLY